LLLNAVVSGGGGGDGLTRHTHTHTGTHTFIQIYTITVRPSDWRRRLLRLNAVVSGSGDGGGGGGGGSGGGGGRCSGGARASIVLCEYRGGGRAYLYIYLSIGLTRLLVRQLGPRAVEGLGGNAVMVMYESTATTGLRRGLGWVNPKEKEECM